MTRPPGSAPRWRMNTSGLLRLLVSQMPGTVSRKVIFLKNKIQNLLPRHYKLKITLSPLKRQAQNGRGQSVCCCHYLIYQLYEILSNFLAHPGGSVKTAKIRPDLQ